MRPEPTCIFCKRSSVPFCSREHIIPESLSAEGYELVLPPGVVCDRCNNRLSKADRKLIEAFGPLRALAEFKSKKGKPIRIDSATHLILMSGNQGVELRLDGRVSRGLHKIGLELLVPAIGLEAVLQKEFDGTRDYALGVDAGFRPFIIDSRKNYGDWRLHGPVSVLRHDDHLQADITLFGYKFSVTLSGSSSSLLAAARKANHRHKSIVLFAPSQAGIMMAP